MDQGRVMLLSGAEIIWECLQREGVELVFGYPGGAILPTYDAMGGYPSIHHVLTRHEQGATHMADGYARATGRVGVAIATSGPGATNLVTGIGTAMMDSSPIVCITGQVPLHFVGTDAFQEADVAGITLPTTKHNYLVTEVEDLAYILREAFHIARTGRPGPVLVDIPKDIQIARTEFRWPEEPIQLPGMREPTPVSRAGVEAALELLHEAERPVILAGHGVLLSAAEGELLELAERTETPVSLTLLGKGAVPEEHALCLGMMGMHGHASANHAIQEADLLIACGMRFDDRVTGNLKTYAPQARKIHIDIDPAEIGKNVAVDVGLVGDLKPVLAQLLAELEQVRHPGWLERIRGWQEDERARCAVHTGHDAERLLAAEVMHALWQLTEGEAINVTDVGQHQMVEAQYYPHRRPHTLITSGGMGTMGFGVPAAIGAKMGCPDEEVWAIVGDGGFQMTMAELATAVQEKVEINIALINNGFLGMVRQWQEFFYDKRYHATPMVSPDFCKLAAAFEIPAVRVERLDEIEGAVRRAQAHRGGPFLVEFMVEQHDVVYPMVPAGADLHEMIRRPPRQPRRV
jgi:acetolactate synthase-1/2/3 large subunit